MITLNWIFDKKRLYNPLSPVEEIQIGMSLKDFNEKYYKLSDNKRLAYVNEPKWFCYKFNDCMRFHFNAELGILESIYLEYPYKGTYKDKVGIGSKVKELFKIETNISFDDDHIIIGDNELGFVCNEDFDGIDESEYGKCVVESIIII